MDRARWANKEFKALGAHNIVLTTDCVSDDYKHPAVSVAVRTSDTGHLEMLKIEPKRADLPLFSVRWDLPDDAVDVDLCGDPEEARKFAEGRDGYYGHKTDRVSESPRTHAINIETPLTGPVFRGTISLNIDLALLLRDAMAVTDSVEVRTEAAMKAELMRGGEQRDDEQ
jgi:hypothetical protein